jgi:hypothetical protein
VQTRRAADEGVVDVDAFAAPVVTTHATTSNSEAAIAVPSTNIRRVRPRTIATSLVGHAHDNPHLGTAKRARRTTER